MTRIIRPWGIAIFVAVALIGVLTLDWIVEGTLENLGTDINGASVELDEVDVSLWPAEITLTNVQITDPYSPSYNRLQVSSASLQLDGLMLLRRHLVVNSLSLDGVQINAQRATMGDTQIDIEPVSTAFNFSSLLPELSFSDMDTVLASVESEYLRRVSRYSQEIEQIEARWKVAISELPDDDAISDYRARWSALSSAGLVEKMIGLKQLKDDVRSDLDKLKTLQAQLRSDRALVRDMIKAVRNLPEVLIDSAVIGAGLGGDSDSLVRDIVSDAISFWLHRSKSVGETLSRNHGDDRPPRGQGRLIDFEDNPVPRFLLRKAEFSGEIHVLEQTMLAAGRVNNLSYPIGILDEPMSLTLDGRNGLRGKLLLDVLLHPDDGADFTLQLDELSVTDLALGSDKAQGLLLEEGVLFTSLNGSLNATELDVNFMTRLDKPKIAVAGQERSDVEQLVADTVNNVDRMELELKLSGPVETPKVTVRSNMNKIFAAAVDAQVSNQTDEFKQKLLQRLTDKTSDPRDQLIDQSDFFSAIEDVLSSKLSSFPVL
jgi:uncharacterized protein (TIGR03545 family)